MRRSDPGTHLHRHRLQGDRLHGQLQLVQLVPEGQRGAGEEEEGEPGQWQGRWRGELQPLLRLHEEVRHRPLSVSELVEQVILTGYRATSSTLYKQLS